MKRHCSACGLPGHTKTSHKRNPANARRASRKRQAREYRGGQGVMGPEIRKLRKEHPSEYYKYRHDVRTYHKIVKGSKR